MKKQVSAADFEKKVEVESAYLQHYNNLPKHQADKAARENVSEEFEVV
mgnify:CR=1 FL=1